MAGTLFLVPALVAGSLSSISVAAQSQANKTGTFNAEATADDYCISCHSDDMHRGGFIVAGITSANNNYLPDGSDDNDWTTEQPTVRLSLDAIQEFKIITGEAPAEFGRRNGGQVVLTTRSGSNEIHGGAFLTYRDGKWNAPQYDFTGILSSHLRASRSSLAVPSADRYTRTRLSFSPRTKARGYLPIPQSPDRLRSMRGKGEASLPTGTPSSPARLLIQPPG